MSERLPVPIAGRTGDARLGGLVGPSRYGATVEDFRSDPMPSSEGRGRARAAWDAYARTTNKVVGPALETLLGPAIRNYSVNTVADLLGFWMLWHLYGGFQGLRDIGMSRSAIFRKTAAFRKAFGTHPDEFELGGVRIDPAVFLGSDAGEPEASDTP